MTKYIDLSLKQISKDSLENTTLDKAIKNNQLTVILGAPGSGKSSILKKYAEENNNCTLLKIKDFLKLDINIPKTTETILLDGMDEYRSIVTDKVFVTIELAHKLNKIIKENKVQVVLTCREMDWYGENDVNALSNGINITPEIYQLLSLAAVQKKELAEICNIEDSIMFIDKFSQYGVLENPQMFVMIAKLYRYDTTEILKSKKELYLTYIKSAREQNSDYTHNELNLIDADDFMKITGYIAAFYIFNGIEQFDDSFVDNISFATGLQNRENIKLVLRSSRLFSEKSFYHRTIAEFSLAYFLNDTIENNTNSLASERIKGLFIKHNRIPTELRGTFAWLCSLSMKQELISIDPYYQAVHGDCSTYDTILKKKIIVEVKKYSETDPYFHKEFVSMSLDNYYEKALDDFIMHEFEIAVQLKNHYAFFIIGILTSSSFLSIKIQNFLKEKILDNAIPTYYKSRIIEVFFNTYGLSFIKEVLDEIKTGKLHDSDDSLKEQILSELYPDNIDIDSLANHLGLYSRKVTGHCHFLIYADFEQKLPLVKKIYESSYDLEKSKLSIPKNLDTFIADFFCELVNQYDDKFNASEIFNILKQFRRYYKEYEKLKINTFRTDLKESLDAKQGKIQYLANELYSLYVDDIIYQGMEILNSSIYHFNDFFSYEIQPERKSDILFSKIKDSQSIEINKALFGQGFHNLPKEERTKKTVQEFAAQCELREEYNKMLNPPKQEWQIEEEKRRKKQKKEQSERLKSNEKYFRGKMPEELQKDFKTLHFIAQISYFPNDHKDARDITQKTFNRLKKTLKNAINTDSIAPKITTLKSLAKDAPTANRAIDMVYFTSTSLQKKTNIKIKKNDFFKYLYINDVLHSHIGNISESEFLKIIELKNTKYAVSVLKEYILILYRKYTGRKKPFAQYIDLIDDISKLQTIIRHDTQASIKENLIFKFLKVFAFAIKKQDLELLLTLTSNNRNKILVEALQNFTNTDSQNITIEMGLELFTLLDLDYKEPLFEDFDRKIKINLLNILMNLFNSEKFLEFVSGFQSKQQQCASFLNRHALISLNLDELRELEKLRKHKEDIWNNRIKARISDEMQKMADNDHTSIESPKSKQVESLREFFLSGSILSANDFFIETCLKIKELKSIIEDNRNNDKNAFYSADNTSKDENSCRDIIENRLEDRYDNIFLLSREKHEADNRVDINIKYKKQLEFEVQIECKKDKNRDLYTGIENQLIEKYLSSAVQYGIYLIFFFGESEEKQTIIEKLQNNIPKEYKSKIELICIDLKK